MARHPCEGDYCTADPSLETNFCPRCDCDFCDECWDKQSPHRPGKRNYDAHEKISRRLIQVLEPILNAPTDPKVRGELLRQDVQSKWFAWHKDDDGDIYFQDYDRYATLMLDSTPDGAPPVRFPQLVSVIGETGNGKSSIIKMFIDLPSVDSASASPAENATPVVGSVNDNLPTTGNVHLYADPVTFWKERPILLADMEGLRGGELRPMADDGFADSRANTPHGLRYEVKQKFRGSSKIKWANTAETQTREHAVTQLYPRVLYTFSDVVVFVMKGDFRAFEAVLSQLLDWASRSIERSVNQPCLPHAIIVSNFTDNDIDPDQWDVAKATRKLLDEFQSLVNRSPKFSSLKQTWNERGCCINNVEDLLLRYYSSFSVIRIPYKGRYARIKDQVGKLRSEIQKRCDESFESKKRSRFILDADLLQTYLTAGFNHFAVHLDAPFNFLDIAMRINPISRDFAGNILQLASLTHKLVAPPLRSPEDVFGDTLARFVASCILLDIVRSQRPGQPLEAMRQHYHKLCDQALEKFVSHVWPCSYRSGQEQCANVLAFHQKGHQNAQGRLMCAGPYKTSFAVEDYRFKWHELLERHLLQLDEDMTANFRKKQYDAHVKVSRGFYRRAGSARKYKSHSACLSCLHAFPEHPLPCGHILCTKCIEAHGDTIAPGEIIVRDCPLHQVQWTDPCHIHMKPPSAGVRVLSLDGGGVRGIVILEQLKALSEFLPKDIEPQRFFDLIVGTSTGGLIALGLGVKGWTIDHAIEQFKSLVGKAFTPRMWGPGALISKGALYKTRPLEEALKVSLGDHNLFGGTQTDSRACTKVAVTSATYPQQRPVIFGNYNRKTSKQVYCDWEFERPNNPAEELKVWEVARATSAAPTIFKPFRDPRTQQEYIDGALYYKCPVELANLECKMVFPDTADKEPDILLAIGTGEDESKIYIPPTSPKMPGVTRTPVENGPDILGDPQKASQSVLHRRTRIPFMHKLCKDFMSRTLEAERAWNKFVQHCGQDTKHRYQRLNLRFPESIFPKMDESGRVPSLQTATRAQLDRNDSRNKLRHIARRLVATSFYFQKQSQTMIEDRYRCKGNILCRFPNRSDQIRRLGTWLGQHLVQGFTPYFEVRKRNVPGVADARLEIDERLIQVMTFRAHFELRDVSIPMNDEQDETMINLVLDPEGRYPISGFPMRFVTKAPQSPKWLDDQRTETASTTGSESIEIETNSSFLQLENQTPRQRRPTWGLFTRAPTGESDRRGVVSQTSLHTDSSVTSVASFSEHGMGSRRVTFDPSSCRKVSDDLLPDKDKDKERIVRTASAISEQSEDLEEDEVLSVRDMIIGRAERSRKASDVGQEDTTITKRSELKLDIPLGTYGNPAEMGNSSPQSGTQRTNQRRSHDISMTHVNARSSTLNSDPANPNRVAALTTQAATSRSGIGSSAHHADTSFLCIPSERGQQTRARPGRLRHQVSGMYLDRTVAGFGRDHVRLSGTDGDVQHPAARGSKHDANIGGEGDDMAGTRKSRRRPPALDLSNKPRPDSGALPSTSSSGAIRTPTRAHIAETDDPDLGGISLPTPRPFSSVSQKVADDTQTARFNIHRVEQDFESTADYEMELRADHYVCLVYEVNKYWALCTSLDGSIKGIAPRHHLSKYPLGSSGASSEASGSYDDSSSYGSTTYPESDATGPPEIRTTSVALSEQAAGARLHLPTPPSSMSPSPAGRFLSTPSSGLSPMISSGELSTPPGSSGGYGGSGAAANVDEGDLVLTAQPTWPCVSTWAGNEHAARGLRPSKSLSPQSMAFAEGAGDISRDVSPDAGRPQTLGAYHMTSGNLTDMSQRNSWSNSVGRSTVSLQSGLSSPASVSRPSSSVVPNFSRRTIDNSNLSASRSSRAQQATVSRAQLISVPRAADVRVEQAQSDLESEYESVVDDPFYNGDAYNSTGNVEYRRSNRGGNWI